MTRISRLMLPVVFAATMATLSGGAFAAPADDAQLAAGIKAALAQASDLKHANIQVVVADGKVKLSGWVDYPQDIRTAERLAQAVTGVKDVEGSFRTWSSEDR